MQALACMHASMYSCKHVCMYAGMHVCMQACMHVCMNECYFRSSIEACKHVPIMYACKHVCMQSCMHAIVYACNRVCMQSCNHACMHEHVSACRTASYACHASCMYMRKDSRKIGGESHRLHAHAKSMRAHACVDMNVQNV